VTTPKKILFLVILVLFAFLMRVPYLTQMAFPGDLRGYFAPWAVKIEAEGLFNVYQGDPRPDYPPVYLALLGVVRAISTESSGTFARVTTDNTLLLLKLFPVLFELLIIAAAFLWLQDRPGWRWIVPGALAVTPGLLITSAMWGQADAVFTLFLVGVLIALNRDRPRLAWLLYALAFLTKFQAVVLLPLIVILCFRRYGLRKIIEGAGVFASVMALGLLPFILNSGLENTFSPYFGSVDAYPATTVNAFNFWYLLTPPTLGGMLTWSQEATSDKLLLFDGMTYKTAGFALLGVYVLGICASLWMRYRDRLEFVWAAALYLGFYMLPTQMHERYLYPAVVFAIFALAQEKRMWLAALGLSLTYLYNVLYVIEAPFYWFGIELLRFLPASMVNWMIALNLVLLIDLVILLFRPQHKLQWIPKFAAGGMAVGMLLTALLPSALPVDATRAGVRFSDTVVLEGYSITREDTVYQLTLYWQSSQPTHDEVEPFIHLEVAGRRVARQSLPLRLWYGKAVPQRFEFKIAVDKPFAFFVGVVQDRKRSETLYKLYEFNAR
jgi:Gpi18-like mannosyltransferase